MLQIKFDTNEFVKAFNFLKDSVNKSSDNVEYHCIAFKANDEGVKLSVNNGYQVVSYFIDDNIEVSGDGSFLVDAEQINRILSATKKDSITFNYDEHVTVLYGRSKHTLNKIEQSLATTADDTEYTLKFKDNPFKYASKMLYSCGDEGGYSLACIRLDFAEDKKYMVACSRTTVFAREIEVEGECHLEGVSIPVNAVKKLCKLEGDVDGYLEGNYAIFRCNNIIVWTRLCDGRYPKWRCAVAEGGSPVSIKRDSMTDACKSLVNDKETIGIHFDFGAVCIATSKSKEVGDSYLELDVVGTTSSTMSTTLDPKYIIGWLNATEGNVNFEVYPSSVVFREGEQVFVMASME